MLWLILTLVLAYFIYLWAFKPMNYWKERKLAYAKGFPIAGSFAPLLFKRKTFYSLIRDLYNEFPDKRFNGVFFFQKPSIILKDLELIKQITIKDFDNFMNHTNRFSSEADPLFSKNLIALEGEQWRNMRATLSPSFTGSKMKYMFNLIADCAEHFTNYFENNYTKVIEVDMKDISSRFANDVIATTAFGIKIDSLNDKDNEFFMNGKDVTKSSLKRLMIFLINSVCPALIKALKIPLFSATFTTFFQRIMQETIEAREKHGIVRSDMVQLLLESRREASLVKHEDETVTESHISEVQGSDSKKSEEKHILTDDDIAAQGVIFFFAGFETVSTAMSFMSCELAINLDVQRRLQVEIDEVLQKCNGKVTYEALMGMKYLDMVVSESLRKWPPAGAIDRACLQDYVVQPTSPNEKPFVIEKGVSILIPVAALHYDPQYFPNPEKFDPERFSEENKSNIVPSSYMPFGAGPRICIASRFALMETKILFFQLLSKFTIVPVKTTVVPLRLEKGLILRAEGGFCVGFEKRFPS